MTTPKGIKCVARTLMSGDKVLIYSDTEHIVLQLRHQVPTEEKLLEPSFKVAVPLTSAEAIAIANELLNAALPQLAAFLAVLPTLETEDASIMEVKGVEVARK